MAIRIGDLLVQNSVITTVQLNEALKAQKTYGGRLGTNLIELGYISEQSLATFLAVQLKLPAAGAGDLDSIAQAALDLVPKDLAQKYRIVPISVSGKKLSVAMADPTDLRAIDDLAFRTGHLIQPMVAPDVLLAYALEKHYGVRRESRYVRLSGAPDSEFQVVQPTGGFHSSELADPSGTVQVEERGAFMERDNAEFVARVYTIRDASLELVAAKLQTDTTRVLQRFVGEYMTSLALFTPRAGRLWGYGGEGLKVSQDAVRSFSLTPAESPLLAQVIGQPLVTFLDCGAGGLDAQLAALLGVRPAARLLSVPLIVNSQLLGLYFCAGAKTAESDVVAAVQLITTKTSYALQMIYLRNRILES